MSTLIIRHICLEPQNDQNPLGIFFRALSLGNGSRNAIVISGIQIVSAAGPFETHAHEHTKAAAACASAPALAPVTNPFQSDESYLVQVGDFVIGVAGVSTEGMDPETLSRVIDTIRQATAGQTSRIILHLSSIPLEAQILTEAAFQMMTAAQQLMGNAVVNQRILDAIKPLLSSSTPGGVGGNE